jgi:two-component system, NtrC family, nitrogen regulation sensor histidine kinase GlnL
MLNLMLLRHFSPRMIHSRSFSMPPETNVAIDIPLPMLTLNHQGKITAANIEAQSRLNSSENALLGQHIGGLIGPESEIKAIMQHLMASGQPLSDHALYLRSSGEPCALHMGAFADGYVMIMVPEANRQEHDLHVKRQEMAEAVARIALEMAHEVKNPLAALRGAAQWLAEQPANDAQREAIYMMLAEVERIRQRIDDFLQLGPRADIGMEQVNIHQMIDDVCRPIEGVVLRRVFDPGLPAVQAHATRLRQAIENLWNNALEAGAKYIEWQTRINPTVRLQGHKGAVLELRISNDGQPIPTSMLNQIFEPFVTSGKKRGSGLGLALVQRVMLEHKGQVSVQSVDGRTAFILRLPLVQQ